MTFWPLLKFCDVELEANCECELGLASKEAAMAYLKLCVRYLFEGTG
jgi:hypothetical protein